jgi:hypothetical protein
MDHPLLLPEFDRLNDLPKSGRSRLSRMGSLWPSPDKLSGTTTTGTMAPFWSLLKWHPSARRELIETSDPIGFDPKGRA